MTIDWGSIAQTATGVFPVMIDAAVKALLLLVTAGALAAVLRKASAAARQIVWMLALAAMEGMVRDMTANRAALETAAASGFSTATDLADWLVRELGLPFREAHHVTGALVAKAEAGGVDLPDLRLNDMQAVHAGIREDVFAVLGVQNSVASRVSYGGTAPDRVRAQVARWKEILG